MRVKQLPFLLTNNSETTAPPLQASLLYGGIKEEGRIFLQTILHHNLHTHHKISLYINFSCNLTNSLFSSWEYDQPLQQNQLQK